MKRPNNWIPLLGILLLTGGCATEKSSTLGSLKYSPQEKEEEIEFKKLNHQEVRSEYKEILDLFEDKQLKEQIERRIADVYMMEGVHDQNQSAQKKSYYVEAIKAYRNILDKYPDSPDNAEVLYQLAKAYDMEGNQSEALKMLTQLTQRHPTYPQIPEAYFRMGDIYFNSQDYRNAEKSYLAVTQLDKARLSVNAHYMLGWAYYKQVEYYKAINSFVFVMDSLVGNKDSLDHLSKAEQPLVNDTLHSMTLALDRVGGARAVESLEPLAKKTYVWMVYNNIGDYYLGKELYEESAAAFRVFVSNHRHTLQAPTLHEKLINAYLKGKFPRQALEEKEKYVEAYGIASDYQGNRNGIPAHVSSSLRVYLDELARHYYSEGQAKLKAQAELQEKKEPDQKKIMELSVESIASFDNAADFYQQYVSTFPNDERIDEVYFLKAESLFLAKRYAESILDYERVAYQPKGTSAKQHAANAGYAAIISYQKHIESIPKEDSEVKKWQARAVDSMLQFAKVFHADKRSPTVLTNAAEYLFSLDQYQRALEVSNNLIANNPQLDNTLKKTAYGIVAHSYFKLGDFQNAEAAYLNQRNLIDTKSEEYGQVSERLATAIYKKSEGLIDTGAKEEAIAQLLKVKTLTPDSSIRVTAQFDAATMLLELQQWARAIAELKELQTLFPKHELAVEFPRKLAYAYEKSESWSDAAFAYLGLSKSDPDAEIKREALFLAATMFENSKDVASAITHFKAYDAQYENPASQRIEARYHLASLYETLGDSANQLNWLNQIVEADQRAGSQRNERSQWLAAWARVKIGDSYQTEFTKNRLYLPLVKSLPAKNQLLEKAVKQYQLAADYGQLEYVTMSSYKIANMYQQLAKELRESQKPAGLSADEVKAYADILEEQALPLDGLAIELHRANIDRAWAGSFNEWINRSFAEMRVLDPARFNKTELVVGYGDEIR